MFKNPVDSAYALCNLSDMTNTIDIKAIRTAKNWTQPQMAAEFGVNTSTVWRWEHEGIPNRGMTKSVLERLHVEALLASKAKEVSR